MATGTVKVPFRAGYLHAVELDYHASAPATTTVVINENGTMARNLINAPAGNTDVTIYPVVQSQTIAGVALTGIYQKQYVSGNSLTVTVALSDALVGAVTGFIQIEPTP